MMAEMTKPTQRGLLSGRRKLGNFLLGSAAGALALLPIFLALVAVTFDSRLLLVFLGAPLVGLLVLACGTTPEVEEALDDYEAAEAAEESAEARERERVERALARLDDKITRAGD